MPDTLKIIGRWPRLPAIQPRYKKAVGTIFPDLSTIVVVDGIHATQRAALIDSINEERKLNNHPELSDQEI